MRERQLHGGREGHGSARGLRRNTGGTGGRKINYDATDSFLSSSSTSWAAGSGSLLSTGVISYRVGAESSWEAALRLEQRV